MNSNRCHIFGVAILLCHAVSAAHAQDPRTLLVAPFQNISAQPSDNWIGAGIAETVATDLRRLPGVRVIGAEALAAAYARGGSPSQDPPRSEDQLVIARELGADLLVGGSYERVGDHVWVTAGLVDVQGGAATHVVRLDSAVDELFELQDRLVSELAAAVTPGADQAPSPPASTDPPPQRGSTDSGGHGNGVGDDAGSSLTGELVIESGGDGNEQTGVFTVAGRATVGVARASAPPVIDGLLDDPVWNGAVLIDQFVQTSPLDGAPVTEATQVWIAYDREHLYFGLYAHYTDTSIIRANRVDRDRAGGDDWIALMFDTFHDQQRAYRFSVNGYGVQGDAIINAGRGRRGPPGGGGDSSWNALFSSSGRLVDDGWTAEIAIPFKSLRYPSRGDGAHRWGFQVSRTIQHKDETVVWSPVSRDIAGFLTQMGVLDGLSGLSTSRNLEILPTFTGIQIGQLDEETGSFSDDDLIPDLGVNVKYGLTSDLTADFTVNPDFSQIESDRPQITVNQRFPLFFPELRPFFLEGQEIFDTPGQINLVHSRTIVDPRVGGKLTGKAGNTTLGVLVAERRGAGPSRRSHRSGIRQDRAVLSRPSALRPLLGVVHRGHLHRSGILGLVQPRGRDRWPVPSGRDTQPPIRRGGLGKPRRGGSSEDRTDVWSRRRPRQSTLELPCELRQCRPRLLHPGGLRPARRHATHRCQHLVPVVARGYDHQLGTQLLVQPHPRSRRCPTG